MVDARRGLVVLLSILIASPAVAPAGDCTQVIDQLQTDAARLQADANAMGLKITAEQYLDPALKAARGSLKSDMPGNRDVAAREQRLRQLRDAKDKLDGWNTRVRRWSSELEAVANCLEAPQCDLVKLLELVNEEVRAFVQSIGTEQTAAAAKRVGEAAKLLQDYNARLAGTALGGASAAASCLDQRIAEESAANDAVDLREAKAKSKPPAPAKSGGAAAGSTAAAGGGGSHMGAIILTTALLGGAAVAGVAAGNAIQKSVTNSDSGGSYCVTAADLVAAASGALGQYGPNTACTNYIPCGRKTNMSFAVCVDLTCDTARYYYSTSDGNQFYCTTTSAGAGFHFDSSRCDGAASNAVNYCAAH